jgi:hypothetical protein
MRKAIVLFLFAALAATQSFATYVVVLKDGTRYTAKSKWTMNKGKALITLENGQTMQLDPALIDVPRSEQVTKIGMANANVLDLNPAESAASQSGQRSQPSLGDQIKLRRNTPRSAAPVASQNPVPAPVPGEKLPDEVLEKFDRAFENIGIFEKKLASTSGHALRAEMTVDTEDRVFNAISATSFLMVRNAGVDGARIDMVELFMRTTTGGAAGRFQMTRTDAEALDQKKITQQEYFVRNVIY